MLNGTIPTEIGNLLNLTKLDFSLNKLEGPIPTEIGSMAALTVLGLCKFPRAILLQNQSFTFRLVEFSQRF
jgi:Leucine-rich repeat (LRR) protein